MPNEFDLGLANRKAIYRPFAQAVPNAFVVNKRGQKSPCKVACPAGVNAHGYVALVARGKFFTVGSPQTVENCFVMMAVDGSSDVEMQLLMTETRLTRPAGAIK